MEDKFFTTEQVANILQVHPFTILKYIKQGKLKGYKLGRVYRIKESEINKFLEARLTKNEAPMDLGTLDPKIKSKPPKDEHFKIDPSGKSDEDHFYRIQK